MAMTTETAVRGGAWLIEDASEESTFTPERISDEHKLIAQTTEEFAAGEVEPAIERLEQEMDGSL